MSSYYNSASVCSVNGPTDEEIKEYWKSASASFQYHESDGPYNLPSGSTLFPVPIEEEKCATEEECSICSRMKDVGSDCWWCGN